MKIYKKDNIRDLLRSQGWDCSYVVNYLHKEDNLYYTDVYQVHRMNEFILPSKVLYCPTFIDGKTVVLRRNDFI